MLKNQLKIIVLKILEEQSLSGYDLIKEIHKSTGSWKPSFGSMYPLLKDLHSNKLVTFKIINRRKVYSITSLGKQTLKDAMLASQNMMKEMTQQVKLMKNICSTSEKEQFKNMIKTIHKNPAMFGKLTDEIDRLQRIMIEHLTNGKFESKEKEIKKILNDAILKLKKV